MIPACVLVAIVAMGEMGGWSKSSEAAVELQVAQESRQHAREGKIPVSGYRF
jgi:hypothetical protein